MLFLIPALWYFLRQLCEKARHVVEPYLRTEIADSISFVSLPTPEPEESLRHPEVDAAACVAPWAPVVGPVFSSLKTLGGTVKEEVTARIMSASTRMGSSRRSVLENDHIVY